MSDDGEGLGTVILLTFVSIVIAIVIFAALTK